MYRTFPKLFNSVSVLVVLVWVAARANAAISVGSSGAGPLTFDTAPSGTDFLSAYFGGTGASFTSIGQEDAAVATIAASDFGPDFTLAPSAAVPPSTYASGFLYNTTGLYLQSRATTTSGAAT